MRMYIYLICWAPKIHTSGDPQVPRSRIKHEGDGAFAIASPKIWNNLLVYIKKVWFLFFFLTYKESSFIFTKL